MRRPAVLLVVLSALHLGGQQLVLGHIVPALLVLPVLAVAAFEATDRAAVRHGERRRPVDPAVGNGGSG